MLIGGGHSHALLLKKWGMSPLAGARLTVIDPNPKPSYSGMLPGYIAGHYQRSELDIDLVRLARHAGASFVKAAATGIDPGRQCVEFQGRPAIFYDALSINIGAHSALPGLGDHPDSHIIPIKPLARFASAWDAYLQTVELSKTQQKILIIGGGVGGVEVALAIHHRLAVSLRIDAQIQIVDAKDQPLEGLAPNERKRLLYQLKSAGIAYTCGRVVTGAQNQTIEFEDSTSLHADFIIGATGARAYDWVNKSGLPAIDGFLNVDRYLRCGADTNVFAAGDCAHMTDSPREKAGVFAVHQAPVLYNNLRAALGFGALQSFRPQQDYLKLISLGRKSATAVKFGLSLSGDRLWSLKDRIDQRFMTRLSELPDMSVGSPPEIVADGVRELMLKTPPLCGGCGAKVDIDTLRTITDTKLAPPALTGDDSSIEEIDGRFHVMTTDHLREFWADPWTFSAIAATHALGDIWAMGARPSKALASIILPPMSSTLQQRMLEQIMSAARKVIEASGAEISGGHTSQGPELSVGFAVTGWSDKPPVKLSGVRDDDVLVLTKPIGTGVILAGEMAKKANADWVFAALDEMARPMSRDAEILARTATAMTDVTGFGLAGHLLNIAMASRVGVELNWEDVPLYEGAADLSAAGVRSSLWQSNRQAVMEYISTETCHDLLFDPQTAGGLLATLPSEAVHETIEAFERNGAPLYVIGHINDEIGKLIIG